MLPAGTTYSPNPPPESFNIVFAPYILKVQYQMGLQHQALAKIMLSLPRADVSARNCTRASLNDNFDLRIWAQAIRSGRLFHPYPFERRPWF